MTHHDLLAGAAYVCGASLRHDLGVTATAPSIDAVLRLGCLLKLPVGAHVAKPRDPERAAVGALNELIRGYLTAARIYPNDPHDQRNCREGFAAGFYGQPFTVGELRLDAEGAEKLEREIGVLE